MPQNKTKKIRRKRKQHKYSHHPHSHNSSPPTQFKSIFDRTPTPYPYSNYSTIYSNSPSSVAPQISQDPQYLSQSSYPNTISSSAYVKAVSNNGNQWHVDMDINGVKKHGNLTNSQIMDLLSYPASKQNLRSQLLHELRNIPRLPLEVPIITPNFGMPIVELYQSHEEPRIRYIYKKGCSTQPMMMNNLSPLREASIVAESDEPSIHLIPMKRSSSSRGSSIPSKTYKNKTRSKNKKK
jgi:hypothetical protein